MPHSALTRWTLRLPAHVLNGLTVALGIGCVQLLFGVLAGPHIAQLAVSGAVYASLADLPDTRARSWRRVLSAAAGGTLSAWLILLLMPHPQLVGIGIAAITFAAMMTLVWGPRAGAVSFAPLLAIIFTMGLPKAHDTLQVVAWNAAGALAYVLWSQIAVSAMQRRYRSLLLANAIGATVRLLQSRANLLEAVGDRADTSGRLQDWILNEAALAERLQAARDLLFTASDTPRARQETALLLHTIELRDILLASQLDIGLLGADEQGRQLRHCLAERLRQMGDELDAMQAALRGAPLTSVVPREASTVSSLFGTVNLATGDGRARLLPALVNRVLHLQRDLDRMQALLRGGAPQLQLSREELRQFVGPTSWPLVALRAHATLQSPVLRHALRAALALATAYYVALVLPWASHPQWLVLSVAVVLRGNLGQTLARRNARVLGTIAGCMLVMVLAQVPSTAFMGLVFLVAVGLAHSFAVERYLVTAVAATVMALLQAHLAQPGSGFPIAERVADTVLGALLAWGFSYMLPSWERRNLPLTIARGLQALQDYARHSLQSLDAAGAVAQRLARRQAYDALAALAATLQRSAAEPASVRPPVHELALLLDHGQRLMAHLSVLRLMLARGSDELGRPEASAALQAASEALGKALAASAPVADDSAAPAIEIGLEHLPAEPPTQALLPWLLWRLQVTVHDARVTGVAASRALASLAPR